MSHSRYRKMNDNRTPNQRTWIDRDKNGVVTSSGTVQNVSFDTTLRECFDVVTPGYHRIIASGGIVNTAMTLNDVSVTYGSGTRVATGKVSSNLGAVGSIGGDVTGGFATVDGVSKPSTLDVDVPGLAASRKNAIVSALSNIDPSDFAFGEDLLEIGKTIELMRHPFRSVIDITHNLRKDFKKRSSTARTPKAMARAASDSWLKYQFVYGTTLRSLMNLHEALIERPKPTPKRRTARGFYSEVSYKDYNQVVGARTYNKTSAYALTGRVSILYEGGSNTESWATHLGLRVKDVPATLWAVAPSSWVIDRFLNISDSLNGLANLCDPRVRILASSVSERITARDTLCLTGESDPSWSIALGANRIIWDYSIKTRTPRNFTFSDAIPAFQNNATSSISSIADLSALATGKLLRVFK